MVVFALVCFHTCERICELSRNFDFANWRLYNADADRFILEDTLVTAQSFLGSFVESTIAVFFCVCFFDTLTARFEKYKGVFFYLTEEVLGAKKFA